MPTYKIVANKTDITKMLAGRLIELRVTDEAGYLSDELEIVIDDSDNAIELPAMGATLEAWIGYDNNNTRMGLYIVDSVSVTGPPDRITVKAKAAFFAGKAAPRIQSHKTRTWPAGTTLGDLIKKIAADNGLGFAISKDLATIALPHTAQTDESDLHLLTRLSRRYNATIKPSEGKIVMVSRGSASSASGKALKSSTISRSEVTNYDYAQEKRTEGGSVSGSYYDAKQGKTVTVTAGSGEPHHRIRHKHASHSAAQAAAKAKLDRKTRGAKTLKLDMPGRVDLIAEGSITTINFRPGLNASWNIFKVVHTISRAGFITEVEAEQAKK